MPEDYTDQCYCCVSANADIKELCIDKGHCIFLRSGTNPGRTHPKEVRVGALTDYLAGMSCREVKEKWNVSHGYVSNMLARAGIPGRQKEMTIAAIRKRQEETVKKRKLIPYAGKESK